MHRLWLCQRRLTEYAPGACGPGGRCGLIPAMKRQTALFALAIGLLLAAGCMTTTTTRGGKDAGRAGVNVAVQEDGTLLLYGNPVDRETLAKRLIREEDADRGRAVVLEARGDVRRAELVDLRAFLVSRRIPNVVIVTQRNAIVYEGRAPAAAPAGRQPGAIATQP